MSASGPPRAPPIRWDVLADHLEQGAVLFERFEAARSAANYTLDEVARRIEAGWMAHFDALAIAGQPVIEGPLAAILAEPKPSFELMMAGSVVLLAGRWALLERALWSDDGDVRAAIIRVCALFADASFDRWIVGSFAQAVPPYRAILLELAAARHLPLPSPALSNCLRSESEAELAAAAGAARHGDRQAHLGAIEALIEHDAAPVRDAAIVTALHWGSQTAWQRCRALASTEQTCTARALRLLALLGDPRDHGYVLQAMRWEAMRPHAIRSLGFTGNLAAVEHLLPLLEGDDPNEARLACEALALLTDIDPSDDALLLESDEGEADEDDDAKVVADDVTPGPEVPTLDPAAARAWWADNQGRHDASRRNLRGRTDMPGAMLRLLAEGRMRDRPDVALSLSIRSGGRIRIDCDALVARQRQQLHECAGSSVADLFVRHSSW